jgi:hypothetical protein
MWETSMKFNIALNDEERKDIKDFIDELLKSKKLKEGDFIESGYLGVKVSDILKKEIIFDVYRIINVVEVRRQA